MQARDFSGEINRMVERFVNEKAPFNEDFCFAFIVRLRELLEQKGSKKRFAHVNLFCNWAIHDNLSQKGIDAIYDRLFAGLRDTKSNKNDVVAEAVSLKKFRNEILDMASVYGFQVTQLLPQWPLIVGTIARLWLRKPMLFSDDTETYGFWIDGIETKILSWHLEKLVGKIDSSDAYFSSQRTAVATGKLLFDEP